MIKRRKPALGMSRLLCCLFGIVFSKTLKIKRQLFWSSQRKPLEREQKLYALADGIVYFHKGRKDKSTVSVLSPEVYAEKTKKADA